MAQIKQLVVQQGDQLLMSQLAGYETLRAAMEGELAPLQQAVDAAQNALTIANDALVAAQTAKDNAQITYDAAQNAYNVQAVDYQAALIAITDLTDQLTASQLLFQLAATRNLLDTTSPN